MKIKYIGPHDAVRVLVDGRDVEVERGGTADLPDELCNSLLEQKDAWQAAKPTGGGK